MYKFLDLNRSATTTALDITSRIDESRSRNIPSENGVLQVIQKKAIGKFQQTRKEILWIAKCKRYWEKWQQFNGKVIATLCDFQQIFATLILLLLTDLLTDQFYCSVYAPLGASVVNIVQMIDGHEAVGM